MKRVSGTSLGENVSGREIVSGKGGLEEMVPGKRSQGDSRGGRERGIEESVSGRGALMETVSGRGSQVERLRETV